MKARGLTVGLAFLLATVATLTVFLYVRGLEEGKAEVGMIEVVVPKADIVAGTSLDDLVSEGGFTTVEVPEDAVVAGAVTDLSQLEGMETSVPILAGEQISTARFAGSEELPGGTLGIPSGFQGVSIPLDSPRVVAGAVSKGDRVRIMATFSRPIADPPVTVVLVPEALVLEVGGEGDDNSSRADRVATLALAPQDAQKVVFAHEQGSVWFSLLPPDEAGRRASPVGAPQVIQ